MNFQLQDNQQVPYSVTALDAAGLPTALTPGDTIAPASSDPTLATVVPDATPAPGTVASGLIVAASPAKLGTVQVNFTVTHNDGSAGPTGQVAIDVVGSAEASIAVALGSAVPQPGASSAPSAQARKV